jgi:hypothetical protein
MDDEVHSELHLVDTPEGEIRRYGFIGRIGDPALLVVRLTPSAPRR